MAVSFSHSLLVSHILCVIKIVYIFVLLDMAISAPATNILH